MKPLFKIFVLSFILFWSCSEDEELSEVENTADIAAILDKGVTLDSISLDYATMYTSTDGFPVITPTPVAQFAEANEILLYFDFVSSSRDAVVQYYEDLNEAYLEQGIVVDYGMPYDDKLEGMVVEVKKNTDEFRVLEEDTEQLTLIPSPEINSQHTFAKYEFMIQEFNLRYTDRSFPEYYVLSFDEKEPVSHTYVFRITFTFNNAKAFVLTTRPIAF